MDNVPSASLTNSILSALSAYSREKINFDAGICFYFVRLELPVDQPVRDNDFFLNFRHINPYVGVIYLDKCFQYI